MNFAETESKGALMSAETEHAASMVPCPHDCRRFGGKVPGHVRGSNWDWVPCWCNGTFLVPAEPDRSARVSGGDPTDSYLPTTGEQA